MIFKLPFDKTGYFSTIINDYLQQKDAVADYYNRFPSLANFEAQMQEKAAAFSLDTREVLVKSLLGQYKEVDEAKNTKQNIALLSKENTFTITTGHQLNLFTGPLYFVYKIVATINLCKQLKAKYPDHNFVPIYWMATEDHDFEEINYFRTSSGKIQWDSSQAGPVGRFSTEGLSTVMEEFAKAIGTTKKASYLLELFKESYVERSNLAEATRTLVHHFFGKDGLVIIDGDDRALKSLFIPYMKEDILSHTASQKVTETLVTFPKEYKIQVNPREINLFYLGEQSRERIVKEANGYALHDSGKSFTTEELLEELHNAPEQFSPNVILRPLYQEVILPNLCYIGGGGELAYWLELKRYFESQQVPFPMLLLRNSVQNISAKQEKKLNHLNIDKITLFQKKDVLINQEVKKISKHIIDFTPQRTCLENHFKQMRAIAAQTDASFIGAVQAQEKKQLKGLDSLEKRLLKAEKRKHQAYLAQIRNLHEAIFPNGSLEERYRNFSSYYLEYGDHFIADLKEQLDPLEGMFYLITQEYKQ